MNYVDFDLNLIKTFVSVYENEGIVLASKKLFISQPAVTMSIKKLESIVGGKLFVRLPKGVKPTLEGEKFYEYCKTALNNIELGIKNFNEFQSLSKGTINIGASNDTINFVLMPIIKKFLKQYPNINVNFVEVIPKRLPYFLSRGDIDIAFLEDDNLLTNKQYKKVYEMENVFFCNKEFVIDCINLNNTNSFNFALYKKDSGNYVQFEKLCKQYNLNLTPKFSVSNFFTMQQICLSQNYIGFAPKKYIDIEKFNIIKNNFKINNTNVYLLIENNNLSFVCKKFLEYLDFEK